MFTFNHLKLCPKKLKQLEENKPFTLRSQLKVSVVQVCTYEGRGSINTEYSQLSNI